MAKRAPLFLAAALLLLLVVASGINAASTEHGAVGRTLLQEYCAKWSYPSKKKTCVGCKGGYYLKGGYCYKETTGYKKGPVNTYGYKKNTGVYVPNGH